MEKNEFGRKVLERAKAKKKIEPPKKQSEAERLFFLFFPEASHYEEPSILLPFDPVTYVPYLKEAALAILGTGIIGENGLKGHARHKNFFPVNQRDLIGDLVNIHYKYTSISLFPGDILRIFDRHFDSIVTLAHLAGVTDKKIKAVRNNLQRWRIKISQSVSSDRFPSNWRELMKEDLISSYQYHPKTEAQAYAVVFLEYAPEAKNNRIATWVNAVLRSLDCPTVKISGLSDYVKKRRELKPRLSQQPSK
jgi:hypothetical protein